MGSEKKQRVVDVLNKMISMCEPFTYEEFNFVARAKDKKLRQFERKCSKVGVANYGEDNEGISTLSLIATIADILADKRLCFQVDENGVVVGVQWYVVEGLDFYTLEDLETRRERSPFTRIDF